MKVTSCDCKHAYQDKNYGQGKRVHNIGKAAYRCTVCGKEKSKS